MAPAAGAAARRHGYVRERAGTPAPGAGAADRATSGNAAARTARRGHTRQRAAAAAAGFGDRAHHRHPGRQARLYRDRRDAVAVRSIGRAVGRDLLHRLCRQQCRVGEPPGHLRLQRRSGRGFGVSEPRPGRAAHSRISRQRRRYRALAGQSADLARLHRSGDDRSGRNGLEPAGQGRRRQRVLWRAPGCANAGQDHRALSRQERPRQLAQISPGRELRRVSRRQGGAGAAARPGHHGVRHRDGVTADRGRLDLRRQPVRARRRIAAAVAGGGRARAQRHLQQGSAGRGRAFRLQRISHGARRPARSAATRRATSISAWRRSPACPRMS